MRVFQLPTGHLSLFIAEFLAMFFFTACASAGEKASSNQTFPGDILPSITVTMTDFEFSPSRLSPKQGQTVIFLNAGKEEHWPASNIHPSHEIYSEFDPKKGIPPGASWSFRFDRIGEWRFHDHLFPEMHGVAKVE